MMIYTIDYSSLVRSYRVPTQVLQSLRKSYICFSICKALQSLIFWVFSNKRSFKVLFLIIKKVSGSRNVVPFLKSNYLNQSLMMNYFTNLKCVDVSLAGI